MDYAWTIAIVAGGFTGYRNHPDGGDLIYDANFSIRGCNPGKASQLMMLHVCATVFRFNLDLFPDGKVQFEDDEYYYYVKAVPKMTVATPEEKSEKDYHAA